MNLATAEVLQFPPAFNPPQVLDRPESDLEELVENTPEAPITLESERRLKEIIYSFHSAASESGESSVSADAIYKMVYFLIFCVTELPLPAIVVESDKEIGMDWDGPQGVVSLTIDESDWIGYSAVINGKPAYGKVGYNYQAHELSSPLPRKLRRFFRQLYPSTLD